MSSEKRFISVKCYSTMYKLNYGVPTVHKRVAPTSEYTPTTKYMCMIRVNGRRVTPTCADMPEYTSSIMRATSRSMSEVALSTRRHSVASPFTASWYTMHSRCTSCCRSRAIHDQPCVPFSCLAFRRVMRECIQCSRAIHTYIALSTRRGA